jgi:hypothetical protein
MDEVIVEGLEPKDFIILEEILRSYKVSLNDTISFSEIIDLHNKIKQIIDYLKD